MALDREELNKRRQQREALRKKRQAEQRTLMIRLIIAAVVLLWVGVLVFTLSRAAKRPVRPHCRSRPNRYRQQYPRKQSLPLPSFTWLPPVI